MYTSYAANYSVLKRDILVFKLLPLIHRVVYIYSNFLSFTINCILYDCMCVCSLIKRRTNSLLKNFCFATYTIQEKYLYPGISA